MDWRPRLTTFYNIYFGSDNPPQTIVGTTTAEEFDVYALGLVEWGSTYYWQVDTYNDVGAQLEASEVVSYTTMALGEFGPDPIYPPNNGIDIYKDVTLTWPAVAGVTSYDVYLGTLVPLIEMIGSVSAPDTALPVILENALFYGFLRNDIAIIAANSFGVSCNILLIGMKKWYSIRNDA